MSDQVLTIVLKADGTGLTGTLNAGAKGVTDFGSALDGVKKKLSDAGGEADSTGKKAEGAGESFRSAGEKIKGSMEGVQETLRDIAAAAGVAFSVDKIVEWSSAALEGAERIGKLSQSLGVSTQYLQTLSYAAGLTNTSLDTVAESFERVERAQLEARDGNVQTAAAFKAIGISIADLQRLNPEQLLQKVATGISALGDGSTKTTLAMTLMGRGAADNIPFINELGKNVEELTEKAAALGLILSQQDQAAFVAFKDQTSELGQQVKGLANQFDIALLPALTSVVAQIQKAADAGELSAFFKDVGNAAKFVADNLNIIIGVAKALTEIKIASWAFESAGAIATLATGSIESMGALLGVFGGIPGVLALIAVGLYAMSQYEDDAAKAASSLAATQTLLDNVTSASVQTDILKAASETKLTEAHLAAGRAALAQLEAEAALQNNQSGGGFGEEGSLAANSYALLNSQIEKLRGELDAEQATLGKQHDTVNTAITDMKQFGEAVTDVSQSFKAGDVAGNMQKFVAASNSIHAIAANLIADGHDATIVHAQEDAAIATLSTSLDRAAKSQGTYNTNIAEGIAIAEKQRKDLAEYQTDLDTLSAKVSGPYVKAWEDYTNELIKAGQEGAQMIKDHIALATVQDLVNAKVKLAGEVYAEETKQIKQQHDVMTQANQDLQNQLALWGVLPQRQAAVSDGLKEYDTLLKSHYDFFGNYIKDETDLKAALDAQLPSYIATKQAINDVAAAQKQQEDIQKEWQGIAVSGFDSVGKSIADFATGGIKSWKDFGKALLDDTKQFIAAIIAEFLKLTVFNGIINSLFGLSGSSALPTGLGNGILGQLFSGGGSGGGISSLISGGNSGGGLFGNLFGGGSAGASAAADGYSFTNYTGATDFLGDAGGSAATDGFNVVTDSGAYAAGEQGMFSQLGGLSGITSLVGGVLAGYGAFKAAGGGAGGAAAGAAYGYGTYVLGTAATAGFAVAATSGISAGIAAGFAAIPVVGWIALAAMAVNAISGGKLFGTAWKPIGSEENISVDSTSASVTADVDEKKQGALFSGAKWRAVSAPVDQQTQDSVATFFTGLQTAAQQEATAFGLATSTVVAGTFQTTFDKAGKMLTQESTVLGQKFSESISDFFTRISAETILANLPAAQEASTIAQQWRSSATDLLAGAEFLAQASQDIQAGHALVQDDTLTALTTFVKGMQQQGESLIQTYVRLSTETTAVQTIFGNLGLDSGKAGEALVKFDDDLVTAAGGIQNLATAFQTYYTEFYSQQEQADAAMKALQSSVTTQFAGIGEDPTESLAKFRQDFEAAMPTLTPAQVLQWLAAGDALYKLDQALGTTADQANAAADAQTKAQAQAQSDYDSFLAPYKRVTDGLTDLQHSLLDLGSGLQAAISQAEALAKAAGMQGASAQDIATIIQAATQQGVAAYQELVRNAQQAASALYGDSFIKAIQDKIDANNAVGIYRQDLQKQLDDANANKDAQAQGQRYSDATSLAQQVAQIAALSGGSIDDILKNLGIPLDSFATDLKLQGQSVEDYVGKLEDQAKTQLQIADNTKALPPLLQDILDAIQGKPLTYANPQDFGVQPITNAATSPGGKPIAPVITAPRAAYSPQPAASPGAASSTTTATPDPRPLLAQIHDGIGDGNRDIILALRSVEIAINSRNVTRGNSIAPPRIARPTPAFTR